MDGRWAWGQATVDLAAMDIHSISYLESAKRMRTLLQTVKWLAAASCGRP
jgi:hypothetical protein